MEFWDEVRLVLKRHGFAFSQECRCSPKTADVAASGSSKLLIRLSPNIDSIARQDAEKIMAAGAITEAEPIILGLRGHERMCDSAIYERFSIPAMTPTAFESYISGDALFRAERGGLAFDVSNIDSLRLERGISRNQFAQMLGVSVTMVKKYESGSSPGPAVAERLFSIFGEKISARKTYYGKPGKVVEELGRAPFEFALRSRSLFLVSSGESRERVSLLNSFAEVLEAEPVVLGKNRPIADLLDEI